MQYIDAGSGHAWRGRHAAPQRLLLQATPAHTALSHGTLLRATRTAQILHTHGASTAQESATGNTPPPRTHSAASLPTNAPATTTPKPTTMQTKQHAQHTLRCETQPSRLLLLGRQAGSTLLASHAL